VRGGGGWRPADESCLTLAHSRPPDPTLNAADGSGGHRLGNAPLQPPAQHQWCLPRPEQPPWRRAVAAPAQTAVPDPPSAAAVGRVGNRRARSRGPRLLRSGPRWPPTRPDRVGSSPRRTTGNRGRTPLLRQSARAPRAALAPLPSYPCPAPATTRSRCRIVSSNAIAVVDPQARHLDSCHVR